MRTYFIRSYALVRRASHESVSRITICIVKTSTHSLQLLLLIVILMMRNCPAYLIISDGQYSLYSFTFTCNQITTLRKGRKCNLFVRLYD